MADNLPLNSKLPDNYFSNYKIGEPDSQGAHTFFRNELNKSERGEFESGLNWRMALRNDLTRAKIKSKAKRRRKAVLTRKQRAECGLLKLPKDQWKYNDLEPMRKLWQEFMRDNLRLIGRAIPPDLSDPNWTNFSQVISKSELVGAEVKVVRSKVPSQVGIEGTLVLESRMTVQVVTKQNLLKIIPKIPSVFEFVLDNIRFTIFGKNLVMKPSEKSVKKIKSYMLPDL